VLGALKRPNGRLFATARAGKAHVEACLDDYAFVTQGLLDLYESTFDVTYVREALAFAEQVEQRFTDRERGGYFTTGEDHAGLIARLKSTHDGALPAGGSVHTLNLMRLAALTGRDELRGAADAALAGLGLLAQRHPQAFSQHLLALDFRACQPIEVAIVGAPEADTTRALVRVLRQTFRPQRVVAVGAPHVTGTSASLDEPVVLLQGKSAAPGEARAYVCVDHVCAAPVHTPAALERALQRGST
jgi:uncharacterized protein